ncbi:MAG: outer membrane lipoprotein-sorting protein [Candidatus Marinimicrobia bacterium]|nr:outer membrane lipoprotein-sorting protein [Candidatus Neomarinimicrobiota bacterium]
MAQYLELYYMNGDPDDFEQLIDFDYRHAQMIVRINKADGYIIQKVVRDIEDLTRDDPHVKMLGGHAMITSDMNISIVNGQIKSLILAFTAIAIILMIIFRSFTAGLFASLPLVLAEIILFGIMGYCGVRLDTATALLSSIMIGVGVDYTIHFLWRYRSELRGGNTSENAVRTTLLGSGKGIVFNAWSVIVGFAALVFSAFRPIQYFGFLVVISISVCLVAALVLVPAMCILWKPKFLEERKKMKKRTVTCLVLLLGASLFAGTARDIVLSSRERSKLSGLEAVSTLVIRDAKERERVRTTAMASKSYPDNVEKRIIRFLEPADVKGMGMLIVDHEDREDDMWIYLPVSRKSRRIVSSEKSSSFMGSEFSKADMSAPNPDDFRYELLGEEEQQGVPCWKIEIRPVNRDAEDEYGFFRKISWITKETQVAARSEYYDFDNILQKVLTVTDHETVSETPRVI